MTILTARRFSILACTLFSCATASAQFDLDGDGVVDDLDNCTTTSNAAQTDSDGDGFGNACDADFNNDCVVNAVDLGLLRSVFFSNDSDADLNGDGVVNAVDLGLLRLRFFAAPGPSGQPNVCQTHSSITVITRTGTGSNHNSGDEFELCTSTDSCWTLDEEPITEHRLGQMDHQTFSVNALSTADIDQLTLRPVAGSGQDAWRPQCLTVLLDDDLLYCNDGQNALGQSFIGSDSGSNEIAAYTDTNIRRRNCQSCYASALTHGPMVGHTTPQSARIWLRSSYALPLQVRFSTQSDFSNAQVTDLVEPQQDEDFTTIIDLDDLEPGTLYYYDVLASGVSVSPPDLNFVTAPAGPAAFRAAYGSCMKPSDTDYATLPIFNDVATSEPDILLMIGDNHYANTTEPTKLDFFYRNTRRIDSFANVLAGTPTWAVWDDHDYTGNNDDGSQPNKENSLAAFKRFWANDSYGSNNVEGIWSRFSYGDVDFFLLDDRYYRGAACSNTNADTDADSMLGEEQLIWLISELKQSTATFKAIVSGSQWNEAGGSQDSWACFSSERDTILDEVMHAGINGVVLLSGDVHKQEVWRVREASDDSYALWELTSSSLGHDNGDCPADENPIFCAAPSESYAIIDFDTTASPPTIEFEARDRGNNRLHGVSLDLNDICEFCAPRMPRDQVWHQDRYGVRGGVEPGDQFGAALASADFDNDGIDDLAVGIPLENIVGNSIDDGGAVQVFYGSDRRLSNRDDFWTEENLGSSDGPQAGDHLGASLAAADFDGDGFGDLAMGVPDENFDDTPDAGRVHIIYGGDGGLDADNDQKLDQDALNGAPEEGDRFGEVLASGDFNADGYADLIVGAPAEHIGTIGDAGFVQLIFGSSNGLTEAGDKSWHQSTAGMPGDGNQEGDRFGAAVARGDFNADSFDDLAIAIPDDDVDGVINAGAVIVLYGSTDGLDTAGSQYWHQNSANVLGVNATGDRFGAALAAGDFDGDGFEDLAIGIPGEDGANGEIDSGAVSILRGAEGGLTATNDQRWDQDQAGVGGSSETGDAFGAALHAVDINGDGMVDLAIGAPNEAVVENTIANAGSVQVLFGTSEGLQASDPNDVFWHQSRDGFKGEAAANDAFGSVLMHGDFDGDGVSDLAVGVPNKDTLGDDQSGAMVLIYGENN
ncbi:MAG: alkaline phosphatase D family protein [Gammaproteobacteria bacterium]